MGINSFTGMLSHATDDLKRKLELLDLLFETEGITVTGGKPILPRAKPEEFPLSFAQKRLWFLNQVEPGPHYNDHFDLRLQGPLDIAVLQRSLDEIVRRHEVLRATFTVCDGEPIQKILPPSSVELPLMDLVSIPESDRMREATCLAVENCNAPFDLTNGPIVRTKLLRLRENDHLLLLALHHIAIDGWSRSVFLRELTTLYEAYVSGQPSPLSPLSIQYADFAAWQEEWVKEEQLVRQLNYWKEQLAGVPTLLELPTTFPRPAIQSFRGARHTFMVSKRVTEALKGLSQNGGCTLFMTLLAAFQTLIFRYTGQADIVVGSPIANRNRAEIEPLIGYFVNTLVLRTKFSGNPTFREAMSLVRDIALAAYANQDLPYDKLVEEIHPPRDRSYNPVFQVMFVFQNVPAPSLSLSLSQLEISSFEIDTGISKFDLTINLGETTEGIRGWIEYATDLFDRETVERLAGHYLTLLEAAVLDPDMQVSKLPLLTEKERQQLLVEWNSSHLDYPKSRCIHHLFEEQVCRTPDAVAAVCGGDRLTYTELNVRANHIAHHLKTLGVGPDVIVAVCVERSIAMLIGILGVLKAGGAYLPMDPVYPRDRLDFTLEDAQVPVILTQQSLKALLPNTGAHLVCLDQDWPAQNNWDDNPVTPVTGKNLAYVIYTSGSTGRPKGVALEHHGVVSLLAWARTIYSDDEMSGVLASTSICFDISLFELFAPLTCGGKLLIVENALQLAGWAAAHEITLINTVPSVIAELLRSHGIPGSVRTINLAGEPLPTVLVDQIYQLRHVARVIDLYGPTEDTIYSTFTLRKPSQPATIGRPLPNKMFYILDVFQQPVPIGIPGELYIGGEGLAREYLNRPDLTKQKFVSSPFNHEPGARLYRTGDLVRYRPDGNIEFLGRMDHQVKLRGFRIELGEIESLLLQHPGVREAVACVREDSIGDKRLAAYLVAKSTSTVAVEELREYLRARVPEYMVPSAFLVLDAFPLTSNGKVDRKALPAPQHQESVLSANYVPPRTETEKIIAGIWSRVLRLEKVGVNESFFELGGHSLLTIRVHAQICEALNIQLPIVKLFQYPTISSLSRHLDQASSDPTLVQQVQDRARLQRQSFAGRRQAAQPKL
jgi:amino acid adenylation domain-containing protein